MLKYVDEKWKHSKQHHDRIKRWLIYQIPIGLVLIAFNTAILSEWIKARQSPPSLPRYESRICMPKEILTYKDNPVSEYLSPLNKNQSDSELCGDASKVLKVAFNVSLYQRYKTRANPEFIDRSGDMPTCNQTDEKRSIIKLAAPNTTDVFESTTKVKWNSVILLYGDRLHFNQSDHSIQIGNQGFYYLWSQVIMKCEVREEMRILNHTVWKDNSEEHLLLLDSSPLHKPYNESLSYFDTTSATGAVFLLNKSDSVFVEISAPGCTIVPGNGTTFHMYEV